VLRAQRGVLPFLTTRASMRPLMRITLLRHLMRKIRVRACVRTCVRACVRACGQTIDFIRRGPVLDVRLSLDKRHVCIQRSSTDVDFVSLQDATEVAYQCPDPKP